METIAKVYYPKEKVKNQKITIPAASTKSVQNPQKKRTIKRKNKIPSASEKSKQLCFLCRSYVADSLCKQCRKLSMDMLLLRILLLKLTRPSWEGNWKKYFRFVAT